MRTRYRYCGCLMAACALTSLYILCREQIYPTPRKENGAKSIRPLSQTTCHTAPVNNWAEPVLKNFTIYCGLEELRNIALQISSGMIRTDIEYKILQRAVGMLHSALKARFYAVMPGPGVRTVQRKRTSSKAKSLAFIKAYKVGGTHISSLLLTYAYTYDLNIDPSGRWTLEHKKTKKYDTCVDVAGTNHPPPNFYQYVEQEMVRNYFCNDTVTFMFVRDPVERVWSAYNHYRRQYSTSIATFLRDHHETLNLPHYFLSRTISKAIQLAHEIEIYSQDEMDISLVMLASKSGLGMCDIISEPCVSNSNGWHVSKCNDKKLELREKTINIILDYVNATQENVFYQAVMTRFRAAADSLKMRARLNKYVAMREEAHKACSSDIVYKAYESIFFADPMVTYVPSKEHWFLDGEGYYPIVPNWVCMQAYCRQSVGNDYVW